MPEEAGLPTSPPVPPPSFRLGVPPPSVRPPAMRPLNLPQAGAPMLPQGAVGATPRQLLAPPQLQCSTPHTSPLRQGQSGLGTPVHGPGTPVQNNSPNASMLGVSTPGRGSTSPTGHSPSGPSPLHSSRAVQAPFEPKPLPAPPVVLTAEAQRQQQQLTLHGTLALSTPPQLLLAPPVQQHAPPARAPSPSLPGFFGKRRTPVEGEKVEYRSASFRCWIPAVVLRVCPETGATTLDVRPQPLSLQEQQTLLRPRTRPSEAQLKWVRQVLREGRIDDEATLLFRRHASAAGLLQPDALHAIGLDIDQLLGVSGCAGNMFWRMRTLDLRALTLDDFVAAFWDMLTKVQQEYGELLPCKDGAHSQDVPQQVYEFSNQALGRGSFGHVVLAQHRRTRAKRAVKIISKEKMRYAMAQLRLEIEHLCSLDHPHILKLYEWFDDQDTVYLVTDYCSGGDLQAAIYKKQVALGPTSGFQEGYVVEVMRQVLSAMAHIHARAIVHMDVKSANIMLMPSKKTLMPADTSVLQTMAEDYERPHVVIIDLGVAQLFHPGNFGGNKPMGTPCTMAPEVWQGTVTPKADVFSSGVVFFELLSLRLPLNVPGDREGGARFWSVTPTVNWELLRRVSPASRQLCMQMMHFDRAARPSALQCLDDSLLRVGELASPRQEAGRGWAPGAGLPRVPPEIVALLAKMPERSVLYKSIALSMARNWPANQMPTITRAYQEFSKSSAGALTVQQLSMLLQGLGVPATVAPKAAEAVDTSCDGNVDFTEFVAACLDLNNPDFERHLWAVFHEVDSDHDDLLSIDDVGRLLPMVNGEEVVRDVFIGLTGRTEPGARLDWHTFRQHFKEVTPKARAAPSRDAPSPLASVRAASPESSNASSSGARPWNGFEQGLEQALGFFEKMRAGFIGGLQQPAAGPSQQRSPSRAESPLQQVNQVHRRQSAPKGGLARPQQQSQQRGSSVPHAPHGHGHHHHVPRMVQFEFAH